MSDQKQKAIAFRALHTRSGAFVIPNPWDAGTAKILTKLGFEALATTSAGLAFSIGRGDGAAGREETQARKLLRHPMRHRLGRVGFENIAREHAGEALGVRGNCIRDIRVVVAIAGGRLYQRRLLYAGALHRNDHVFHAHRTQTRPVGLVPAQRRARIARLVGRDDVRVNIDRFDAQVRSPMDLYC